jgi:hypothetical protein
LFLAAAVFAEESEFPQLTLYGENGETDTFPQNKKLLVFLGFQRKAKAELLQWQKALPQNKISVVVIGVLPSYLSWRMTREPLMALCRKAVPKEDLPYFRMAFFDKEKLIADLGLPQGKETLEHIHLFYVDGGKIRWKASCTPTSELLAQLRKVIDGQED